MFFTLESATPFESSILWKLHHSYFAQRGIQAWREGDIPYFSTSNYAFARQHAKLFAAHVKDLEEAGKLAPDAELWVLEGGSGTGIFAANFIAALEADDVGRPGLFPRIRYLMTDYSEKNVRDALATPRIKRYAEMGNLIPARYDLTMPRQVHLLEGGALTQKLVFAINNYICCVLPMRHLQKRSDGFWYDLHVEVRAEVQDTSLATPDRYMEALTREATRHNLLKNFDITWEWRASDLQKKFDDAFQLRVLERLTEGMDEATLGFPDRYLDFMRGLGTLMMPEGLVMTNDYGSTSPERLRGLSEWRPQYYGNTFNQDVNFSIFDAFAAETGWALLRTRGDLASVHTAIKSPTEIGPAVRAEFARAYGRYSESDDLLDYSNAARGYSQKKEPARALRFYMRCADLDPYNAEHRYRVGESALEAGHYDIAIEHLLIGFNLDHERAWDFEFQLGRAYCLGNDNATALDWYEKSSVRAPHPVTHTNMGVLYAASGNVKEAYRCYKRAIALDPEYERARDCLNALKETLWTQTAAEFDKEAES
jgi:tetratricopeptide (TPR) repeat protein